MCECSFCGDLTKTNDNDGLDICNPCRIEMGISNPK